jgi:hypothetical protein
MREGVMTRHPRDQLEESPEWIRGVRDIKSAENPRDVLLEE